MSLASQNRVRAPWMACLAWGRRSRAGGLVAGAGRAVPGGVLPVAVAGSAAPECGWRCRAVVLRPGVCGTAVLGCPGAHLWYCRLGGGFVRLVRLPVGLAHPWGARCLAGVFAVGRGVAVFHLGADTHLCLDGAAGAQWPHQQTFAGPGPHRS